MLKGLSAMDTQDSSGPRRRSRSSGKPSGEAHSRTAKAPARKYLRRVQMTKKLMLLAMAVGALLAFAVPAAAQASLTFDKAGEVTFHGELSTTSGAFQSGPCTVSGAGEVEGSTGEISAFNIKTVCTTNVPGCVIVEAAATTPMELHLETPDILNITKVTFYNVYSGANCTAVGVPTGIKIPAAGNLTGTTTTTGLIHFEKAPHLKNELSGGDVFVDGTVQLSYHDGSPVTIH